RPGDPARVVASADRIATELDWKAKHDVQDMIASAWEGWVRLHPEAARA
ncbi:UDP-glucose 4-epimerase GalE, partial [Streptomyces muensis]|nr:UDP-glucose 4-epimerase GalE [Streptomyces muensis]